MAKPETGSVGRVVVGDRHNRLVAVEFLETISGGQKLWKWLCDCGKYCDIVAGKVRSGHTKSCGCFYNERIKEINVKHGMFGTPLYWVWSAMIQRCTNANSTSYPRYGGRGIQVCQRWRDSFEAFAADVGAPPSPEHSLDRENNEGNYEPGNVRWATDIEQSRNRRNNVYITHNGCEMLLTDFADKCGMTMRHIQYLRSVGYSPEIIYKYREVDFRTLSPQKKQELKEI